MDTIYVQNPQGQVTGFSVSGPADPRAVILEQRIARGELSRSSKTTRSESTVFVITDADTGVTDEKGDLLKSVHGGGLDPDATADALGQPSGSGKTVTAEDTAAATTYVERLETVETKVEPVKTSRSKAADNK